MLMLPLGACAIEDSHIARRAQTQLIGMPEVDLEACLGSPDQHSSFGATDILTYYSASSSSLSYSIPIVGGLGVSNGGFCHATFRTDNGRVTHITYSGEKNATLAPSAYCAPILRSCLAELRRDAVATGAVNAGSTPMNTPTPRSGPAGAAPAGMPAASPAP